jgi:hypothetical protein
MGSFIVRTDSESEEETKETHHRSCIPIHVIFDRDVVSESEEASDSVSSPVSSSPSVLSAQRLLSPPPEDLLSEALLVQLSLS